VERSQATERIKPKPERRTEERGEASPLRRGTDCKQTERLEATITFRVVRPNRLLPPVRSIPFTLKAPMDLTGV